MADDSNDALAPQQPPRPNPILKSLEVLVGTWEVSGRQSGPYGEINGRLAFEWMEGGFYLIENVDIDYIGYNIRGSEYIGYDESNNIIKSYFFGNTGPGPGGGLAPERVWEIGEETLKIWAGFVGSPARYEGRFSDDHNTLIGGWQFPGGGGYEMTWRRSL